MTTTLLRHEFRRTRGPLGLLTAIAAAFTLAGTLVMLPNWPLAPLGAPLASIAVFGLLPVSLLALAVDYWRSAYGRGGYLTQTLPIRGSRIYGVRLVYGFLVVLAGLVVSLLLAAPPALVVARRQAPEGVGALEYLRTAASEVTGLLSPTGWVLLVLALTFGTWMYLVQYYFAATAGSSGRLASLGAAGPFVVWFALYVLFQVLVFVAVVAVPLGIDVRAGDPQFVSVNYWAAMTSGAQNAPMPAGFIPVLLVLTLVLAWWTGRAWNRRLSLR